jgi:hypothetical protein
MFDFLSRLVACLVLTITTLAFAGNTAAQSKPYRATGAAQFAANQSDFTGVGHATHLGNYTEVGNVAFAPTSTPGVLAVSGWSHYQAANGDLLFALLSGTIDMGTGAITATATYVGGTGRFTNSSGASALSGQMIGGGALTIAAIGSLSY